MDSMVYPNNFIQPMAYSSMYGTYPSLGGMLPPPSINFSGDTNAYAINQPKADSFYSNTTPSALAPQEKSFLEKHWWKLLLGAGAVALGAIALKGKFFGKEKPVSFEKVQQNFAEIFRQKDLTKEQTEAMLKNYQEIYKIKDKNTFVEKLFHQVKKDYGYENSPKELKILDKPVIKSNIQTCGSNSITKMQIYKGDSKEEIFDSIAHEFHHMRQSEYMFRANPAKWEKVSNDRAFEAIFASDEVKDIIEKHPEEVKQIVIDRHKKDMKIMEKQFGHLPKFKEGSEEYKQAEKYFEAHNIYIKDKERGYKDYRSNLLEQEAWNIGGLMKEVAVHIKHLVGG